MAVNPGGVAADDFKRLIGSEIAKYSEVVKAANLHFEE
jgi:tripartite-type tricarboxylate transporter receptor subunit TctC